MAPWSPPLKIFEQALSLNTSLSGRTLPASHGDVSQLHGHSHGLGKPLEHRQQGVGGQHGGLVCQGVDDLGHVLMTILSEINNMVNPIKL